MLPNNFTQKTYKLEVAILLLSMLIIFPNSAMTALLCLVLLFVFLFFFLLSMGIEFFSFVYLMMYTGAILFLFIMAYYFYYIIKNLLNFSMKC